MTRIDIPVAQISKTGITPPNTVTSSSGSGHSFEGNDGRVVLEFVNVDGGSPYVVTVESPKEVGGLAVADLEVTVPAAGTQLIGPFPPSIFNQSGTDTVYVDVTTANLRIRAYRV